MDNFRSSIIIAIITFFIAVGVSSVSQTQVQFVPLPMAVIILFIIIIVGVLSDMVGVAATVGRPEPFNARAAKKIFGAKISLYLAQTCFIFNSWRQGFFKYYGMKKSTEIIFLSGRILAFFVVLYQHMLKLIKKRWN